MGKFGNSKYEQLRVEKLMLLVKTIKNLLKWGQIQKEQNFSAVVRVTEWCSHMLRARDVQYNQ